MMQFPSMPSVSISDFANLSRAHELPPAPTGPGHAPTVVALTIMTILLPIPLALLVDVVRGRLSRRAAKALSTMPWGLVVLFPDANAVRRPCRHHEPSRQCPLMTELLDGIPNLENVLPRRLPALAVPSGGHYAISHARRNNRLQDSLFHLAYCILSMCDYSRL